MSAMSLNRDIRRSTMSLNRDIRETEGGCRVVLSQRSLSATSLLPEPRRLSGVVVGLCFGSLTTTTAVLL